MEIPAPSLPEREIPRSFAQDDSKGVRMTLSAVIARVSRHNPTRIEKGELSTRVYGLNEGLFWQ